MYSFMLFTNQFATITEHTKAMHGLNESAIAVESSALSPDWIVALSSRIFETGASFIEAPVLGTRPQAEAVRLIDLAGGDPAIWLISVLHRQGSG